MNPEVSESVFELLGTISESLAVLQTREDPNLQQDISAGRAQVTQALEEAMGCSLEDRICVSALSDIDAMYPDYQFFLRHNGGNLILTEFVLLCKP